jgi:flagellar protein FliO/FliZ
MQMLQQYLGEAGARYVLFALTAIGLLIAILVIWVLIRKALGSRLNFSDKPDRRGRAPRLGVTESFNVDREGRRLVIVRRDNFEHLVMIGGPNDVLIETNILRGERLTVGRNDQRNADAELIPVLPKQSVPKQVVESSPPALTAPLPQSPLKAVSPPRPIEPQPAPSQPEPSVTAAPPPGVRMPSPVMVQMPEPIVAPVVDLPKQATVSTTSQTVAANAKAAVKKLLAPAAIVAEPFPEIMAAPVKPTAEIAVPETIPAIEPAKPTLAERIKSGAFFKSKPVISEAMPPPAPPVATSLPLPEAPKVVVPQVEITASVKPTSNTFMNEMRQLEEAARASKIPAPAVIDSLPKAPSVPRIDDVPRMTETLRESIAAPVARPPFTTPAPPAAPVRSTSKNPFDSLEEEMAKLLGRTPDGKG